MRWPGVHQPFQIECAPGGCDAHAARVPCREHVGRAIAHEDNVLHVVHHNAAHRFEDRLGVWLGPIGVVASHHGAEEMQHTGPFELLRRAP